MLSGFGFAKLKAHYGLDVQGGIRLTYRMDLTKVKPDQQKNPKEIQTKLINILTSRAAGALGVVEPIITAKGDDQIVVDLPGLTNVQQAEDVMGSSARVEFYWAKTVSTELEPNRPYTFSESNDPHLPGIDFHEKIGGKTITPKDPQYKDIIKGWDLILAGDELQSADPVNINGNYDPELHFSQSGSQKMQDWSRRHINKRENLAAVLDNVVLSIAYVKDGEILSDSATIEGKFPDGYVTKLCSMLNSGALPVNLDLLGSQSLDPSLGSYALQKMVTAGLIAFGLIALFLIGYYAFPGFVAVLALSLYVLFTLTVLKVAGATFSLAGIAGFILSVGMAVDANILVFERFKEEIRSGKPLPSALELGFRRALSAIFDSNACTIITSLVLVDLGTGPVKGFATTLVIGVLVSLFTAVAVTRSLLIFFVGSGIAVNPKLYAVDRNWFGAEKRGESLHVVQKSMRWFLISGITIVVSIPFFFLGGFRQNVELQGGFQASYAISDTSISSDAIQHNLEAANLRGGNVQFANIAAEGAVPAHREVDISLPPQASISNNKDEDNKTFIAKSAGIDSMLLANTTPGFQKIGPQLQEETRNNAILGVLLSAGLIIVYLAIRFGTGFGGFMAGLRFGVSAIGALLHDILVVFGTAAIVGFLFHWEVSALFLTAMLTMIGFSVHDTIVIFDRIRENLRRSKKTEEFGDLMNRSITQSFARSINTSGTVIVTLMILLFFGTATNELKFFVASMLIGIISGTYSSIYNASPILYLWDKAIAKKKGPQSSLVGMVAAEMARNRTITTQAATQTAVPTSPDGTRTYGQVRRRANEPKRGIEIEDED
ncbi:MAG TPA: protein translocase subunit SecD [Fimbriimonas sp.]|nr:protein translocase subunit SecD [Fimbriimonas sp.]